MMICLTESEVENWLQDRSIPHAPYHSESAPTYYTQFYAPEGHRALDKFTRDYYAQIIGEGDTLVHVTYWSLYTESDMISIKALRNYETEEPRSLVDAPGHTICFADMDFGVSLFGLAGTFEWSAYVYSERNNSILYNWEGEIFDFWTDCKEVHEKLEAILLRFGLSQTG
jgi:hypothetical protein